MGHDEIINRLSAYHDGEVSPVERAAIEAHLAECGICSELLGSLRAMSAIVRGADVAPLDAALLRRLHTQVDNLNKRSVERFGWALAGVAACVAIVAGIHLSMRASVQSQTASVNAPDAWEGAAVQLSANNDDATPANNGELAMAQWMVTDLSDASRTHE